MAVKAERKDARSLQQSADSLQKQELSAAEGEGCAISRTFTRCRLGMLA